MHIHLPVPIESVTEFLAHLVLIVLGIVIALLIDHWRDARRDRHSAEQAVQRIRQEVDANAARVDKSRANLVQGRADFEALYDGCREACQRAAAQGAGTVDFGHLAGSINLPAVLLESTAWSAAIHTGVLAHLPFEKVQALSRLYTIQARVSDFQQVLLNAAMTMGFDERGGVALADANAFLARAYPLLKQTGALIDLQQKYVAELAAVRVVLDGGPAAPAPGAQPVAA